MKKHLLMTLLLPALIEVVPAHAQLGMLPAAQWAITLESGRQMEGLEIAEVVARLGLRPGDVVADIGAGTGIFSVPLAERVGPAGAVLAVEVDPDFLPMIEAKAREGYLTNLKPVQGEFTDPKLPRRDVDLAFFHDVLHHVQDRPGYLKRLARYVGPRGRIAIVDYNGADKTVPHQDAPEMLITRQQVDEWMRGAGFGRAEEVKMFGENKFYVIYSRGR